MRDAVVRAHNTQHRDRLYIFIYEWGVVQRKSDDRNVCVCFCVLLVCRFLLQFQNFRHIYTQQKYPSTSRIEHPKKNYGDH